MKRSLMFLAFAVTVLAAPFVNASLIYLHANLSGANEVPPNGSTASGFASLTLDTVAQTLTGHIEFSGLSGPATGAHIHCCLPSPTLTGVNVGVATPTPFFPGFPTGVTSGIDDFVLDLTQASSYNNPSFLNAHGGTVASEEAAFIAGLIGYETYLNIHTAAFPGGEIRGFVVPAPATMGLLVLGLAAIGFVSRRRSRI